MNGMIELDRFGMVALGVLIPLIGTTLGSAMVLVLKNEISDRVQRLLLGFASGVMIAASIWSLLMPAIDMAGELGTVPWMPAVIGFLGGMGFLLILDVIVPHMHINSGETEGINTKLGKSFMLIFAVTLHNLPEGMAVGVVFAGMLNGSAEMSAAAAFTLAAGIAIQNFPEGAVISMPLLGTGMKRRKAFKYGFLSGIVEPIGALITIALTQAIHSALPYILSFAAGAMIYVVVEELIPESQSGKHSNMGTIGVAIGFALMMLLDIALG